MKYLYVYILKCSDGLYYTGITNNLDQRLLEHNTGIDKDAFTYNRRPVTLKFHERFSDFDLAIEWETRIKKWGRQKKEALITSDWQSLKEGARCKNNTSHLYK
ncbi:MAG: GIY-YIG nuclease family protein [Bacteroidetes bacterium]|nr:GIY-YIG nuclease family protein [Bacteroidota bacterium]